MFSFLHGRVLDPQKHTIDDFKEAINTNGRNISIQLPYTRLKTMLNNIRLFEAVSDSEYKKILNICMHPWHKLLRGSKIGMQHIIIDMVENEEQSCQYVLFLCRHCEQNKHKKYDTSALVYLDKMVTDNTLKTILKDTLKKYRHDDDSFVARKVRERLDEINEFNLSDARFLAKYFINN